jgi:6-phosphofructokinase
MRIGILTGGGDCPGLNAVIRAVVRKSIGDHGDEVVGFRDGWRGVLEKDTMAMDLQAVRGILPRGGTILGTSRTNPYAIEGGAERMVANLQELGVEALVPIGGEDTLGVATKLAETGMRVVGVPKTIDNDLDSTDYTFGFDTAVGVAMEAIDRLHTTGDSHHRTLVVEVMGRHAGWIALHAGMAGGANVILIPEKPFDVEGVVAHCLHRFESGYSPIVVVSEGAQPKDGDLILSAGEKDAFGHVRWHALALRPRAGHPLRAGRRRRRPRRAVGGDGRPAWHRHRPGAAERGDGSAQAGAGRAVRGGGGLLRVRCPTAVRSGA